MKLSSLSFVIKYSLFLVIICVIWIDPFCFAYRHTSGTVVSLCVCRVQRVSNLVCPLLVLEMLFFIGLTLDPLIIAHILWMEFEHNYLYSIK